MKTLLQLTPFFLSCQHLSVVIFRENIFISEIFWHPLKSRVPWSAMVRQTCFCYHERILKVYQGIWLCIKPINTFQYDVKPSFLGYHTSGRNLEQEIIQGKKCCLIFSVLSILAPACLIEVLKGDCLKFSYILWIVKISKMICLT